MHKEYIKFKTINSFLKKPIDLFCKRKSPKKERTEEKEEKVKGLAAEETVHEVDNEPHNIKLSDRELAALGGLSEESSILNFDDSQEDVLFPDGEFEDMDLDDEYEPDFCDTQGLPIVLVRRGIADNFGYAGGPYKPPTETVYEYINFSLVVNNIPQNCRIPFEHLDTECDLVVNKKTVILASSEEASNIIIRRPETYYRFDTEPERFPCECLCIVDNENFELFAATENLEKKADQIAVFSRLSKAQRKFVESMARRPVQIEDDQEEKEESFTPIRDIQSLEMMYEVCKYTYKPSVRARIESLQAQLSHVQGTERNAIINQLAFAIAIDTETRKHPKRTYEECMAIMDKHVYGLRALKENVVEFIIAMQESGESSFRMLLVGPPGVGKTSFTDGIAECLGDTSIIQIDCSGVNVVTMSGLIKSYGGAKAGKVMDAILEKGRTDVVMLFDEIDKMAADKDGDPYGSLIKPLGPQKKFYDEYVADDTDVSSTKFIATANDVSKIPGYILSRFENNIFYLEAYSREEKLEIAQKHIIPRKLVEYKLTVDDCMFKEETVNMLIDEYCSDEGVRELEGNITLLFRKIITERSRGFIEFPFCVNPEYVESHLEKKITITPRIGYLN